MQYNGSGSITSIVLQQHWQWEYILGSFLVAFLGSMTALYLMKQRTSAHGYQNYAYLGAGAICFGGIGVWSMHFIGMQALILTDLELCRQTGNRI